MTGRERLLDALSFTECANQGTTPEELINAYRDEIRREILGDDANPSSLVLEAGAYRYLSDGISATMADPDRWDGDDSEETILLRYVQHLAAARPSEDR